MSSELAEKIHGAICEDNIEDCFEWRGKCVKAAERVLDGFTVVDLPKPDEGDADRESFTSRIAYVEANPGVVYIGDTISEGDHRPDRVREFALALLAAVESANRTAGH